MPHFQLLNFLKYNLYRHLIQAGAREVLVKRNDGISLFEIEKLKPAGIVLSPDPYAPNDVGICLDVIRKETCPADLEITATTADGIIVGIAHKKLKIFGAQFHPESIASEHGHQLIKNFLRQISA